MTSQAPAHRAAFVAGLILVLGRPALGAAPPLRGLAVDERLEGEAVLAESLNAALLRAPGLPVFARIHILRSDLESTVRPERLLERLDRYQTKSVPVLLVLDGRLPGLSDVESWRQSVHALAECGRGVVAGYEIGGAPEDAGIDPAIQAFAVKRAAVEVRAADPDARLFLRVPAAGGPGYLERLYSEGVAAYVDAVVTSGSSDEITRIEAVLEREDPSAVIVRAGAALSTDPVQAADGVLGDQLRRLGSRVALHAYSGAVPTVAMALKVLDRIKDVLTNEVVRLEGSAVSLTLIAGDRDVTATLPHILLYDLDNLSTYFFLEHWAGESGPLAVSFKDSTGRKPILRDAFGTPARPLAESAWDSATETTRFAVPHSQRPQLVELRYQESAHAARTEVNERVLPPVGEIVFRHQQVQASQDRRLTTTIANARIETHFRPNATDSGFDVVSENRFFSDEAGSEWEETSFTLNGSKWGRNRPPFPLLQPEKVLSLPLDLRLTRDYIYRLEGVDRVGEHACYAVRFEPRQEGQSLYRGTLWIDTSSFVRVKVQAVQTRLSAPVVSNEEVQYFSPEAAPDGAPFYLMSRFTSRQVMLVAGRNLLVERLVRFSDFEVNAQDFLERRASARASDNVMYRDTDRGLRHFVKKGQERVVQDRPVTTAKAAVVGVTVDPSFDYPLPILGINYLDFEFLGKDTQLALLFGGVLGLANVQWPKAIGSKVDLSVDLFAIAVAVNDMVFDSAGELSDERLRDHPFSTGVNLGYQLSSFQKLLVSYQFRYDAWAVDSETAPDFTPPADGVTNGIGLGYEYRRAGYSLLLGGAHYRRARWEAWGTGEEYSPEQRTYWRYTASLTKDFFLRGVHKVHLNVAYFGGKRLDRFSKYQFGMFDDNKVRGVPSAAVRFEELAMFRAAYSLNLFELYRLDLFLDQAVGRSGPGSPREGVTGLGLGLNFRAPWGTMFRAEVGKSFLPERYRGAGSIVGQVMVLKPF